MIDLRQTKEWGGWLARVGWLVEKIRTEDGKDLYVFIRQMPLIPISFLKLQRFSSRPDWKDLKRIQKKYRVVVSSLEPADEKLVSEIKRHGYRLVKDPYLPTKTRVIDLTKSEPRLLAGMSENFRRIIKKGSNAKTEPIPAGEFYEGWRKWARSMILTRSQFEKMIEVYGKKVEFWAAEENGEILSAIMLLYTADACFYYQTWTSEAGRRGSHHVVLTWETMKRAKQMKKKYFNFEGIQDRRFPIARWDGFTEFKRRFGGEELAYPGCFSKWF